MQSPEKYRGKNTSLGKDWSQQVEHMQVPNGTGPGILSNIDVDNFLDHPSPQVVSLIG